MPNNYIQTLTVDGTTYDLKDNISGYATLASPAFTGTPTAPTATTGDSSTKIATTAFVQDAMSGAGAGTVMSVTAGSGLQVGSSGTGTSITNSGTINHLNSVTAQTTQAVYPIKIDAQGHISAYGTAVTITDEKLKVGTVTSGTAYYPVLSTSGTTASTKQIDTAGLKYYSNNGVVQFQVGSSTKIGDIDLINGSYSVSLWPANLTDNRTLTLPNATGTLALTSDVTTAVLTATDDGAGNVTLSVTGVTSANLNSASGVSF